MMRSFIGSLTAFTLPAQQYKNSPPATGQPRHQKVSLTPHRISCHGSWIKTLCRLQQRKLNGQFLSKDLIVALQITNVKILRPHAEGQKASNLKPRVFICVFGSRNATLFGFVLFIYLYSWSTHKMLSSSRRPNKEHSIQLLNKLRRGKIKTKTWPQSALLIFFITDRECDFRPVNPRYGKIYSPSAITALLAISHASSTIAGEENLHPLRTLLLRQRIGELGYARPIYSS